MIIIPHFKITLPDNIQNAKTYAVVGLAYKAICRYSIRFLNAWHEFNININIKLNNN
jgi:hypothetical protein